MKKLVKQAIKLNYLTCLDYDSAINHYQYIIEEG